MFTITAKNIDSGTPYNNITGGRLNSKFSIHEKSGRYIATSARGNSELISLLGGLSYLTNEKDVGDYITWDIDPGKVITLQNTVMANFT